jgi:hypothetical protein
LIAAVKRRRHIAVGVLSVVALGIALLAFGFYWLMSSSGDICGNTIVATELSPDRKLKAVLFERNCGATTGFSSQVSVLPSDRDLPNEGGNVFAANETKGGEPTAWGGPFVAMRWRDANTLTLRHDANADIRFSAAHLGDVAVVLEPAL